MKILHFYKTYMPDTVGGVQNVIDQVIKSTADFGFTSEILTLTPQKNNETIEMGGYLVHRCKSNIDIASTPFSISAVSRFKQLAGEADLIHYHYPYPFSDILHFLIGHKKPSLVTYHSDIIKQENLLKFYKPLQQNFLRSVDHIVATSPNYLDTSDTLADLKDKTSVIPIGLEKSSYPPISSKKKKLWQQRFGDRFFLFVGAFRYYKGLHILIDAMQNSKFPVVVVGIGPLEQELKERADRLGVNNIHFAGQVADEDKAALLDLCCGFVFPSTLRSEAFGLSLLEGAMHSKPLICCEIGTGTTYINIHNKTGIVIPPNDPEALRGAMDYLWDNPESAAKMGKNAHSRYQDIFTAERMGKSYAELYQKLLK